MLAGRRGGTVTPVAGTGPALITDDGTVLRALTKADKVVDLLPRGVAREDVSIGRVLRGVVHGQWKGMRPLAAVLAAVNAIASTIAALPAYITQADDTRADVPTHALQSLIDHGVSDEMTWSDWLEATLAGALLAGNSLSEIVSDDRGRLRELRFVPWPEVTPLITDQNTLAFDHLPTSGRSAGKAQAAQQQAQYQAQLRSQQAGAGGMGLLGTLGGAALMGPAGGASGLLGMFGSGGVGAINHVGRTVNYS